MWYKNLTEEQKNQVKKIIGSAKIISEELINMLVECLGTSKFDARDFLRWWFEDENFPKVNLLAK